MDRRPIAARGGYAVRRAETGEREGSVFMSAKKAYYTGLCTLSNSVMNGKVIYSAAKERSPALAPGHVVNSKPV